MRIDVFLKESPMFAISRAARRFDALASETLAADGLGFFEGLLLADRGGEPAFGSGYDEHVRSEVDGGELDDGEWEDAVAAGP